MYDGIKTKGTEGRRWTKEWREVEGTLLSDGPSSRGVCLGRTHGRDTTGHDDQDLYGGPCPPPEKQDLEYRSGQSSPTSGSTLLRLVLRARGGSSPGPRKSTVENRQLWMSLVIDPNLNVPSLLTGSSDRGREYEGEGVTLWVTDPT